MCIRDSNCSKREDELSNELFVGTWNWKSTTFYEPPSTETPASTGIVRKMPVSYTHLDVYKRQVLSLLELFIVSSLPENWDLPKDCKESFVRLLIGEAIPPLMLKEIVSKINH